MAKKQAEDRRKQEKMLCREVVTRSGAGRSILSSGFVEVSRCPCSCYSSSSSQSAQRKQTHHRLVIVGGGAAGASMSNTFAPKFNQDEVAVVEPADTHYYQPMWTLVGAGLKDFSESSKPMKDVLSKRAKWYRTPATHFFPDKNSLTTGDGQEITYDFLLLALGLQLRFDLVEGLQEAFETPGVCSNYHRDHVHKTLEALRNFKSGNAIFTFPNTPIKCAGAPQKIAYLAEEYFRNKGIRDQANLMYNTALPVIFGIKKYAAALTKVAAKRNITVNTRHSLRQIIPSTREALFDVLDESGKVKEEKRFTYDMLHVGAPCSPVEALRRSEELTGGTGWVTVNKHSLQHTQYSNVFAMGDCSNAPTAKTAAAVAGQCGVVKRNLKSAMAGKDLESKYDGYTSCPLITSSKSCILAEFDYNAEPLETFPFDQGRERRSMYHMKKDVMPRIYFQLMLRGHWEGPGLFRKMMHLGMSK